MEEEFVREDSQPEPTSEATLTGVSQKVVSSVTMAASMASGRRLTVGGVQSAKHCGPMICKERRGTESGVYHVVGQEIVTYIAVYSHILRKSQRAFY